MIAAVVAAVALCAGRRPLRPNPVDAADWCPDLLLARLAAQRADDASATDRSEPPAPPAP